MNSEKKFLLFFVMGFLVILFAGVYMITFSHESTHKRIFSNYDVESEIIFFSPLDPDKPIAGTRMLEGCEYDCREMWLLQGVTEIVGYHLTGFFVAISFVILVSVLFLKGDGT